MSDPGSDYLAICQGVYDSTRELLILKDPDIGFEILLTPPRLRPPLMLIGYQPGSAKSDMPIIEAREKGFEQTWPPHNTITEGRPYRLAGRLREIFAENRELLEQSVALNAIFIRHRDVQGYAKAHSRSTRKEVQHFCLSQVKHILDALDPQRIVVIGLGTLDVFDRKGVTDRKSVTSGATISKRGQVFGREALAIPHLTGARITRADNIEIKKAVLEHCVA